MVHEHEAADTSMIANAGSVHNQNTSAVFRERKLWPEVLGIEVATTVTLPKESLPRGRLSLVDLLLPSERRVRTPQNLHQKKSQPGGPNPKEVARPFVLRDLDTVSI